MSADGAVVPPYQRIIMKKVIESIMMSNLSVNSVGMVFLVLNTAVNTAINSL